MQPFLIGGYSIIQNVIIVIELLLATTVVALTACLI
jgi:hypothetical protein